MKINHKDQEGSKDPNPPPEKNLFKLLTVGDRLRWLIEQRGVKQTVLAAQCGLTQSAISNLITDSTRKPSAPSLLKLAEALGCSPGWIITGEGDPFGWIAVTAPDQIELLSLYRSMLPESRLALQAVARSMSTRR